MAGEPSILWVIEDDKHIAERFIKDVPIKSVALCYHDLFKLDFKKYLKKIKTPTLFIYGENDELLKTFRGTALYNVIPKRFFKKSSKL